MNPPPQCGPAATRGRPPPPARTLSPARRSWPRPVRPIRSPGAYPIADHGALRPPGLTLQLGLLGGEARYRRISQQSDISFTAVEGRLLAAFERRVRRRCGGVPADRCHAAHGSAFLSPTGKPALRLASECADGQPGCDRDVGPCRQPATQAAHVRPTRPRQVAIRLRRRGRPTAPVMARADVRQLRRAVGFPCRGHGHGDPDPSGATAG